MMDKSDDIACSAKGTVMAGRRFPRPWRFERIPSGYRVIDVNGLALAMSMVSRRTLSRHRRTD